MPRLVVPIDDADMQPRRTVELLDLLRTLWHPQVVFLLAGHEDLFFKRLHADCVEALRGSDAGVAAAGRCSAAGSGYG